MKFPQYSPGLNPMKNVWAELSRMIYSRNREFHSWEELIPVIRNTCDEINKNKKDYFLTLHQSVLRRCMDVLERIGGETNNNL